MHTNSKVSIVDAIPLSKVKMRYHNRAIISRYMTQIEVSSLIWMQRRRIPAFDAWYSGTKDMNWCFTKRRLMIDYSEAGQHLAFHCGHVTLAAVDASNGFRMIFDRSVFGIISAKRQRRGHVQFYHSILYFDGFTFLQSRQVSDQLVSTNECMEIRYDDWMCPWIPNEYHDDRLSRDDWINSV